MCQLTMIDVVNPEVFPPKLVKWFTMLDVMENNLDGFGYHLFETDEIHKTAETGTQYWAKHFMEFAENFAVNGIYHVRRSSYKSKENTNEHAHPFREGDIILAHNGSLQPVHNHKDVELFRPIFQNGELIDSQKFLQVLKSYCDSDADGLVTAATIDKALDIFTGTFAFLIHDLKANTVWAVRGLKKYLHQGIIRDEADRRIGLLINTHYDELNMMREIYEDRFPGRHIDISLLQEETVFSYAPGTFFLKPAGTAVEEKRKRNLITYTRSKKSDTKSEVTDPMLEIVNLAFRLGIKLHELFIVAEVLFYRSFNCMDETELTNLVAFLKHLNTYGYLGRHESWNTGMANYISSQEAYAKTGLQFPYILNTKASIDKAFEDAKKHVST